jgi:hypothetical protein
METVCARAVWKGKKLKIERTISANKSGFMNMATLRRNYLAPSNPSVCAHYHHQSNENTPKRIGN